MSNKKVLIVDDEYAAREILVRLVDWNALGFDAPVTASNGAEALELYDNEKFEIVFTDIEMPVMDGIGLIRAIRDRNANQKIIVISCHEKFDYARSVMRFGVMDYLIKDLVTREELSVLVLKVAQNDGKLTMPVSHRPSTFLDRALSGETLPDIQLSNGKTVVFHIIIDNFEVLCLKEGDKPVIHKLREFWDSLPSLVTDSNYDDRAYAVYTISDNNSMLSFINSVITIANSLRQKARKLGLSSMSIGISDGISNASQLTIACKQAADACSLRIVNGINSTNLYKSISLLTSAIDVKKLENLFFRFEELAYNSNLNCIKLIDELYREELPSGFAKVHYYRYINMRLWSIIASLAQTSGRNYELIISEMGIDPKDFDKIENELKMADIFKSFILKLNSTMNKKSTDHVVDRALMLIEQEYKNNISLNSIADALHTHKGYLCRIFKEKTGSNLMQYIINKKIERAKYLLANTQMKIYEVSDELGFETPQYFSHVFSKHTSMSPSEFREAI